MPVCAECGQEHPHSKFQHKHHPDGRVYTGLRCYECRKATAKETPRIPAWPFKFWLDQRRHRYKHIPRDPSTPPEKRPGQMELAKACAGGEVEVDTVSRWFHHIFEDNRKVDLDLVDRSLQNEGSTMLWELVEMAEEHIWGNGYSFEQALRRMEDLRVWRKWA